jgi:hypothetical protein
MAVTKRMQAIGAAAPFGRALGAAGRPQVGSCAMSPPYEEMFFQHRRPVERPPGEKVKNGSGILSSL